MLTPKPDANMAARDGTGGGGGAAAVGGAEPGAAPGMGAKGLAAAGIRLDTEVDDDEDPAHIWDGALLPDASTLP